jgi:hypothetical protein
MSTEAKTTKVKLSKKTKTETPVTESAPVEVPVPATATDAKAAGKSKTTTANIDEIVGTLMTHFKLPEKEVRALLQPLLPSTSKFRKSRKQKKEGEPKKAICAYLFFTKEHRDSLRKENPDMSLPDLTKKMGAMWRECADKSKYEALSKQDKDRYKEEKQKFLESCPPVVSEPVVETKVKTKKAASGPKKSKKAAAAEAPVEAAVAA